jgi:hypothetical protein
MAVSFLRKVGVQIIPSPSEDIFPLFGAGCHKKKRRKAAFR